MTVKIDMEMPKSCHNCNFLYPKGYKVCCIATSSKKIITEDVQNKPSWCPLQEVKE